MSRTIRFPNQQQLELALGRPLNARDAVSGPRLKAAERRLGVRLPGALRAFYRHAGAAPELQEHDRLRLPDELTVENEFLVFQDENQRVVDWGIPVTAVDEDDPVVWQRVNGETPEWFSEEMPFSVFVVERLLFARGVDIQADSSDGP